MNQIIFLDTYYREADQLFPHFVVAYKTGLLNIPCILIQIASLHIQKLTFSASHI